MSPDILREQLRLAVKNNNKEKLEQLIEIAEKAQYPEMAFDIRDARLSLNTMGGGYGGSFSLDSLRERLRAAFQTNDKEVIDATINESIAAGLPGLDAEIQEARIASFKLGGGIGDLKTPEALRAQLKAAMKNKSKADLEKAIIECEEAGYPELSLDLRLARDTLDGMGFGRGGKLSVDDLRLKLAAAMEKKDPDLLESVIGQCVSSGYPELVPDIKEARITLESLEDDKGSLSFSGFHMKLPRLRLFHKKHEEGEDLSVDVSVSPDTLSDQLRSAIKNHDRSTLERLIQVAEESHFPELGLDLRDAREALHKLGGGFGGSLSVEELRQQLSTVSKSKDKDALERTIMKSISAGLPGLHADIQEAREALCKLERKKGGLKSPDAIRTHLRTATDEKNQSLLEKAIRESEEAGYPELSLDLRMARDTLERMGFGRGGKLNADKLRLKLEAAIKKNDPDLLEKVIGECVSSGYSELMPDVQEARLRLESLEEGERGSKSFTGFHMKFPSMTLFGKKDANEDAISADTLRQQLESAVRHNDKLALERLIPEAEAAKYPELGYELREARQALHKMGGGYGGFLTPDVLRYQLKTAIKSKDKKFLVTTIKESVSSGLPGLQNEIQEAREVLNKLEGKQGDVKSAEVLHKQLKTAMRTQSRSDLEKTIDECAEADYSELSHDLQLARNSLENMATEHRGSISEQSSGVHFKLPGLSLFRKKKDH